MASIPPAIEAPWTTPCRIGGTYMAITKTTTEMPAMASVVMNCSDVAVGASAKPSRMSDPILAIITSAISFMPTEKA
ncbi:hypothetical protein D3C80_2099170 [compost metagenome]